MHVKIQTHILAQSRSVSRERTNRDVLVVAFVQLRDELSNRVLVADIAAAQLDGEESDLDGG
jgi:hypothetical protein